MSSPGLDSYEGSRAFTWLSDAIGIPVDQLNFVLSQIVALLLATLYRTTLHPSKASSSTRHFFSLVVGLLVSYFCFGRQALHLVALPIICYVFIRALSPQIVQRWVLAVSLIYLSAIHLRRQIYDYGSYTLDITGPLMVSVQKVSTLAFNLHDGLTKTDSEMKPTQKEYAIKTLPSFFEFFSYTMLFPTLMVGPFVFYKDYIDFIEGTNLTLSDASYKDKSSRTVVIEPSPMPAVLKKLSISALFVFMFVRFLPLFPISRVKDDDEFVETSSLTYKFVYLYISSGLVRCKYYFAWMLSDAISNNAGLGYNGMDEQGNPKWDKHSNVDILGFEFSTNFRQSLESWNLGTNSWLRFIVYDRVTKSATILTYSLSALWHGFYPGYYLTFASGALFTYGARIVRRTVRPFFVDSEHKVFYDVLTFITTRLVMTYITFTFILLEFWPSIRMYMHMYWCLHIAALVAVALLPKLFPRSKQATKANSNKLAEAFSQSALRDGVSRHHD